MDDFGFEPLPPEGNNDVYLQFDDEHETTKKDNASKDVDAPPKYINYAEAKKDFDAGLMLAMDAILDLANEGTDIAFTFSEMKSKEPTLYLISVIFLVVSAVLRLSVAVRPLFTWVEGKWNPPLKSGLKAKMVFAFGVVWSVVEPMTGQRIINMSLDDGANVDYEQKNIEDNVGAKNAMKARTQAKHLRNVGFVMMFFEDIPEAVLDIIYAIRQKEITTLFWVTFFLSLIHFFRLLAEVSFEVVFIKHIPKAKRIMRKDLDDLQAQRNIRCHKYCAVTVDASCASHVEQVVDIISHWMKYSKTLASIE